MAAAHTAAAAGPVLDHAAEAELPQQIVQAIRMQWSDGVGDAKITLKPEYLGDVSISIRVEHGAVTASLDASTPAVREWIQGHESMLRQGLADQGLHLDRLVVAEPQQSSSSQDEEGQGHGQQQSPRQQTPQRQRRRPEDATFEILV
jgi:flagellar hook-length control protein FliK